MIENAYFQFFCGETYFQTELPLDRTSMSVWRGRIGADKLEVLLSETLAAAMRAKAIDQSQMQRVTVDTTAQTKAIAHPTDSHLLLRHRMAEQARQEARRQIAPVLSAAGDARSVRGRQVNPRPRPQTGDALPAKDAD